MRPAWAAAFVLAGLVTVAGSPLLRRLALVTGFVDRPGPHKSHTRTVPYLGGVGLVAGVLVGMQLGPEMGTQGTVLVLGTTVLGLVGLVDDHRTVDARIRVAYELGTAVIVVLAGLRVAATGVEAIDIAITIAWVVGITNALNLMDNMDGLAAGTAATAGAAIFVLALLAGQDLTATVAAALVGACLGFLVYNRPPASIFMGDTGSLFLGFTLAVLSIELDPDLSPPSSFAIPLILLALPVLDTVTVTLGRVRHGRKVSQGGRDHLSHRLVALGCSPAKAVALLVAAEALLATFAVLAGRRSVPLWIAVSTSVAVLAVVSLVTSRPLVYEEPYVGWPRWLGGAVVAGAGGLCLVVAPALVALARAEGAARAGGRTAQRALAALANGQEADAVAEFERAGVLFRRARDRLDGPLTSLGLVVPVVSSNLDTARTLVATGERLSTRSAELAGIVEASQVAVRDGALPLDAIRRLAAPLRDAATLLRTSEARLKGSNRTYLLPPIRDGLDDFTNKLTREAEAAERAAMAARLLPSILGGEGTRRYFVAFQNNSELRATGGLIGNWGELTTENGVVRLSRFGRLADLVLGGTRPRVLDAPSEFLERYKEFDVANSWQQVNVSPDFPTTARVIEQLYPQSGGTTVDGVLAVDPMGLSAFLELTGPVDVPGWPEPLSAANVVDVTLRDAYARFPVQEERVAFLGEVSRRVMEALIHADLGSPPSLVRSLARVTRSQHLFLYLSRPQEQALVVRVGADGGVPPVNGDSLLIVDQNVSANKVDLYLHRRLRYDVVLDPSSEPAEIRADLELVLENKAPASGLPEGVIGPYDERFTAGENRTYLSLYSPFAHRSAVLDGRPVELSSDPELGRVARSTTVSIPPLQSRTVRLALDGRIQLADGGWYRLDLGHQPLVVPDEVEISVAVPDGWRIAETLGFDRQGDGRAVKRMRLDQERTLWVRVERSGWSGFWERLVGG